MAENASKMAGNSQNPGSEKWINSAPSNRRKAEWDNDYLRHLLR
jgi:hypothetical protein